MKTREQILENKLRPLIRKLINEEDDKTTELFNSIDWKKVGKTILLKTGIKTQLSFRQSSNSQYVEMTSGNIADQCGIFNKLCFNDVYLTFFSNKLVVAENYFWGIVNLSYYGNGQTVGTVWAYPNGKIVFKLSGPKNRN